MEEYQRTLGVNESVEKNSKWLSAFILRCLSHIYPNKKPLYFLPRLSRCNDLFLVREKAFTYKFTVLFCMDTINLEYILMFFY